MVGKTVTLIGTDRRGRVTHKSYDHGRLIYRVSLFGHRGYYAGIVWRLASEIEVCA